MALTWHISRTGYSDKLLALLDQATLPPLGPGQPHLEFRTELANFDPEVDLGVSVNNASMAKACHSGLWLLFNFLDESHAISQDLPTDEGSFWHAIMHRREPDAWNSKYWFRQVGNHPVEQQLAIMAKQLGYAYSTAAAFVEDCEQARGQDTAVEELMCEVQNLEWQLLFDYALRNCE